MSVLPVSEPYLLPQSSFFSPQVCSGLTYDEKLALWTMRHLFGPSIFPEKTGFFLRTLFGREIEPVLALAATIGISGINALSSTICNQEELALLVLLEKEQNKQGLSQPRTKKELILNRVSALLAGHGYWLPHRQDEEVENRTKAHFMIRKRVRAVPSSVMMAPLMPSGGWEGALLQAAE